MELSFPYEYENHVLMLQWLDQHVQKNFGENLKPYSFSAAGRTAEWRSEDQATWKVRVTGMPPMVRVEIADPELMMLFNLRWPR